MQPNNMKFFCKEYKYGLIYKINFKFLVRTVSEKNEMLTLLYKINFKFFGRKVFEKNAMLIARYHRNFLKNCETEEHEMFFAMSIHMT